MLGFFPSKVEDETLPDLCDTALFVNFQDKYYWAVISAWLEAPRASERLTGDAPGNQKDSCKLEIKHMKKYTYINIYK